MASRVIIVEKRALNAHSIQAAEDESFAMESHQAPLRHAVLPSFLSSFFSLLFLSLPLSLSSLSLFAFFFIIHGCGEDWLVGWFGCTSHPISFRKAIAFSTVISFRGWERLHLVGRSFAIRHVRRSVVSFLPNTGFQFPKDLCLSFCEIRYLCFSSSFFFFN